MAGGKHIRQESESGSFDGGDLQEQKAASAKQPGANNQYSRSSYSPNSNGGNKKGGKGKIIAIVVAIIAVAAIAVFVWLNFFNKPQPAPITDDTSMQTPVDVNQNGLLSGPFYALLIGQDVRTGTVEEGKGQYAGDMAGRSDTCMLVRVDPQNYKITLITMPRDTRYELDGNVIKINDVYHNQGIEAMQQAVHEVTGATTVRYAVTSFITFEQLVDALGGVSVDVPVTISLQDIVGGDNITVSQGEQDLNGAEALVFARVRKVYGEPMDAQRQTNDRQIVQNLIYKVASQDEAARAASIQSFMTYTETNFTEEELTELVNHFAAAPNGITIYSGTGPYAGDIDSSTGLWLTYSDPDTWHAVIAAADSGEDPNEVLVAPVAG